MADAPSPKAGWYPDPDLVDTVRYWDGTTWTEHRAPSGNAPQLSPSPRQQPGLNTPMAIEQPITTPIQGKKGLSTSWKIVFAVSAMLFIGGGALLIKSSLDSNIEVGRATADAMTVSEEEQEAVAEYFGNDSGAEVDAAPSSGCGSPSASLVGGMWSGKLSQPEVEEPPSTVWFREDCEFDIGDNAGAWTWEAVGSSVTLSTTATECLGEISTDGNSITLVCTRDFMGDETVYDAKLERVT